MTFKLLKNAILEFNPGTLEDVRKEYNLDQPGMMDQAIDILHEWIQKQDHFEKKDFRRAYLERVIISAKGSIEKAKKQVDKICTMRTMIPEMFVKFHAINDFPNLAETYVTVNMPKLTENNYRIYIVQMKGNLTASAILEGYKHHMIVGEYLKLHDYTHGFYLLLDVRYVNILHLVASINVSVLRNVMIAHLEGFGFRGKGIFVISPSKMIDPFVSICKQVLGPKLSQRVRVCKTVESLHEHLPKHLLPEDYGGEQKSLSTLYEEWNKELSTEKHIAYLKEMKQACTNEALRQSEKFNLEYHGMPGSFRALNVD